ncbi:hypothetical protein ACH5AI_38990 [Streptomyces collinus]|uniref:hypothetical protein n=1 Tax=Streptomyces collinus TaxID=42684 RepID=UPI00379F4DC8
MAVSMPESRYDESRLPEWGGMVADTAAEITHRRSGVQSRARCLSTTSASASTNRSSSLSRR